MSPLLWLLVPLLGACTRGTPAAAAEWGEAADSAGLPDLCAGPIAAPGARRCPECEFRFERSHAPSRDPAACLGDATGSPSTE
jgi:hypothetical protein